MAAVMSLFIGATVASQFPHNCQIRMQADPSLGYAGVVRVLRVESSPVNLGSRRDRVDGLETSRHRADAATEWGARNLISTQEFGLRAFYMGASARVAFCWW